jgi:cell division protein FtsI/penicillin-binding protein 2
MKPTTKPGGTASRADVLGMEAGKTTTSEKVIKGQYSKRSHLTFIGFALPRSPFCSLDCD